ncbi:hypothetical protein AAU57_06720 [Nonlabens sp. YIK11]|nr:hypothetical protein AAU57_06720 [Nonlabens sp. YIK11]
MDKMQKPRDCDSRIELYCQMWNSRDHKIIPSSPQKKPATIVAVFFVLGDFDNQAQQTNFAIIDPS